MRLSTGWRYATGAACTTAALLFARGAGADEVTLQSGAVVRGHANDVQLPDHSKAVEIRTPSGALIVLERDSVKQVKRIAAGQKVVQAASKPRLTAKQQAWMAKVRSMVSRLTSGNRAQAQQARNELLKIHDPDALPALTRYLQQNPDEEVRQLYVAILRDLPDPNTVYFLVSQSLFDSSAQIREEARTAIGSERADSARTLYIYALKFHNPNLATRAALGIQEIGDPNGEAIPYLIDNLVYVGRRAISLPEVTWQEWSPSPIGPTGLRLVSAHEGAAWFGQMSGSVGGRPAASVPVRVSGPTQPTPPTQGGETMLQLIGPQKTTYVPESTNNPAVLGALEKVSDQQKSSFGYSPNNWHRWWAGEKATRDLQKRKADTPIPRQPPAANRDRDRPSSN
jgi:hypothetical protein